MKVCDDNEKIAREMFEQHSKNITGHVWDWRKASEEIKAKWRLRAATDAGLPQVVPE